MVGTCGKKQSVYFMNDRSHAVDNVVDVVNGRSSTSRATFLCSSASSFGCSIFDRIQFLLVSETKIISIPPPMMTSFIFPFAVKCLRPVPPMIRIERQHLTLTLTKAC